METISKRKPLIAGIDAGLHTSVALLDLDGNIVHIETFVNAGISFVIEKMISFGDVCVLSTDRAKPPTFVKKISTSLSAMLILPSKNLTKKKKRTIIYDFLGESTKLNDHEKSALASTIFAYRRFSPTFKKLRDRMDKEGRIHLYEDIRKMIFFRMVRPPNGIKHL